MRNGFRFAVLGALGALALAFAGTALASFSPKLLVSGLTQVTSGQGERIRVSVGASDDPTAKVQIFVPVGYQLGASAPGSTIGQVTAHAQAADLGGAILPLTGTVNVLDPTQYTGPPNNLCSPGLHQQVWDLHLTAAGQTLDVPMYVDAATGATAAVASYTIQVCLPPPDVPVGTPGRATFGAKLLDADFTVTTFSNPSATGDYRWRSLWTPYNPGKGTPNAAGTVEAQSVVHLPTQLRLAVTKKRIVKKVNGKKQVWTSVLANAFLTENALALPNVKVTITVNGRRLGSATTDTANGAVHARFLLRKGTASIGAVAVIGDRDLGAAGCTQTFAPVPCADATVAGVTVKASAKVTAYTK